MADDGLCMGACFGCCVILVLFALLGGFSGDNDDSQTNIAVDNSLPQQSTAPLLNLTNETIKPKNITFVYYDHNSSKFEGCYGLNYTVLQDKNGKKFMLDHAETDILGENTNYTFKYSKGIGISYENNTKTEIYNQSKLYYVHELRDDNNTVIKEVGNYTLNDDSHQPQVIPDGWLFVYTDHNSTKYEGDEGLSYAVTHNKSEKHEELHFVMEEDVIGLAYESNKKFDFDYGLSGIDTNYVEGGNYYTIWGRGLQYPNGTSIKTFDIESYNLIQKQKDFLTNYDNRIDEVRHKQEIDAIYEAEDDAYTSYVRYKENNKHNNYYYFGSNGAGVIRSF